MTQMLQVVAGKPSPLSHARGLSIISVLHSCQNHHLSEEAFPTFLGVVKFPSSTLPLLNCVTSFWALNLVSECAETWLPVTS